MRAGPATAATRPRSTTTPMSPQTSPSPPGQPVPYICGRKSDETGSGKKEPRSESLVKSSAGGLVQDWRRNVKPRPHPSRICIYQIHLSSQGIHCFSPLISLRWGQVVFNPMGSDAVETNPAGDVHPVSGTGRLCIGTGSEGTLPGFPECVVRGGPIRFGATAGVCPGGPAPGPGSLHARLRTYGSFDPYALLLRMWLLRP